MGHHIAGFPATSPRDFATYVRISGDILFGRRETTVQIKGLLFYSSSGTDFRSHWSAQEAGQEEEEETVQEYEVQYSVKWVNFTTYVEATSEDAAIEKAEALLKKNGLENFEIRANNEEVFSLEGILACAGRVEANCG